MSSSKVDKTERDSEIERQVRAYFETLYDLKTKHTTDMIENIEGLTDFIPDETMETMFENYKELMKDRYGHETEEKKISDVKVGDIDPRKK
jgi:hypothetical protein